MLNLSRPGDMQPLFISVAISVASIFLTVFVVFLQCDAIGSLAFSRETPRVISLTVGPAGSIGIRRRRCSSTELRWRFLSTERRYKTCQMTSVLKQLTQNKDGHHVSCWPWWVAAVGPSPLHVDRSDTI